MNRTASKTPLSHHDTVDNFRAHDSEGFSSILTIYGAGGQELIDAPLVRTSLKGKNSRYIDCIIQKPEERS